jgi:hypothetical protein
MVEHGAWGKEQGAWSMEKSSQSFNPSILQSFQVLLISIIPTGFTLVPPFISLKWFHWSF